MSILLCTSGASPAVVVEAYWLCEPQPIEVHALTTDSERTPSDKLHAYFDRIGVRFTCTRVAGLADLKNGGDQAFFDEVLFRWYLGHRQDTAMLNVCLAGGFKTMSASMQQAAEYFGAEGLFHVLAETNPDIDEVTDELAAGRIHRVDLATTPGWRPLRHLLVSDFPLAVEKTVTADLCVRPAGQATALLDAIRVESDRLQGRAPLEAVAFPCLALWPRHERAWLSGMLDPTTDEGWLRKLPKVELHCHLGGFASDGDLLDQVRAEASGDLSEAQAISLPAEWPLPKAPLALNDYMALGNKTGSTLFRDAGCLRAQCRLLYQHLQDEKVIYAEIRCSPNNYVTQTHSSWDVLAIIQETFQRCMDQAAATGDFSCHVNLIVIATRREGGDLSAISKHLALAVTATRSIEETDRCEVVGVDLAGFENEKTRPAYFREQFSGVHRCGLAVTVHAGENDDAESIWQAVYDLHARRLGHALHLGEAPDLLRTVVDRRIGVEMCPYANYQIKGFRPMPGIERDYPLLAYLRAGVMVSVNTDNIGISGASISDNLLFLTQLCPGIQRQEILRLQRNALESAFMSRPLRVALRQGMEARLMEVHP